MCIHVNACTHIPWLLISEDKMFSVSTIALSIGICSLRRESFKSETAIESNPRTKTSPLIDEQGRESSLHRDFNCDNIKETNDEITTC